MDICTLIFMTNQKVFQDNMSKRKENKEERLKKSNERKKSNVIIGPTGLITQKTLTNQFKRHE